MACTARALSIVLVVISSSGPAHAQVAAQYAAAESAARQAATKACPADATCNLSMAQYYRCLGDQLGTGRSPRCVAPSCTLGGCGTAAAPGQRPEAGLAPPPSGPAGLAQFNQAAEGLRGMLEASERGRAARQHAELRQAEQLHAMQLQRTADLERQMEQVNRELTQSAALEVEFRARERLTAEEQRAKRVSEMAAQALTSSAFPGELLRGLEPAEGNEKCGPWMAMKNRNGVFIDDLDIAYCGYGPELPSADLRDLSLWWLIRNRSPIELTIDYELSIQCIRACTSGWYGFKQTVPSGKVVGFSRGTFSGWSIWQNRLLRAVP